MNKGSLLRRLISKLKYLHMLDCLPDKLYLRISYWHKLGKKLNLSNPCTFNEKLQWLKINDRNPKYTTMVDKYEAKQYVAERIGSEYIIPTIGLWNSFDEIDFSALPEQFVIKCTHDSGGLIICRDRKQLDINNAKVKVENSLRTNYYYNEREWPYKNVLPRLIAEEYIESSTSKSLYDYKFYCFNGEPKYLYVSTGLEDHTTARVSFLTLDWEFAPFGRSDYLEFKELPKKPTQFKQMIDIAKKLANGTKFLRVDLYEVDGKIYFSELTFSPCGGMMPFKPEEYDKILGDMLQL